MRRLAVIPARGGSKRIPRKNIKLFAGKPIIAYSIENALRSGLFDQIMVSTDDADIASVAVEFGASVPFTRPTDLADDYTGTQAVTRHAVDYLSRSGQEFSQVCCIYATAPLMTPEIVLRGCDILSRGDCDYVVTVCEFGFPIQRALHCVDGKVTPLDSDAMGKRSQDLPKTYHDLGQIYWGTAAAFSESRPLWTNNTKPLILSHWLAQDIDTEVDWQLAELKYRLQQSEKIIE